MNNTSAIPVATIAPAKPADFNDVINLLAVLGAANRDLASLEAIVATGYAAIVDEHRGLYAKLQSTVSETEAALEAIARRNPSWFGEKKNVTTPYGVVKFTSSSELVIADENVSVQLINALGDGKRFLRTVQVLDKEALDKLSDTELLRFAIVRKAKENFKVSTEVVDLGKAVKSAEKSEKATTKTARKARTEGDA